MTVAENAKTAAHMERGIIDAFIIVVVEITVKKWEMKNARVIFLANVPSDLSLLAFGTVPAREADLQELCRKSRRDRD